MRSRPLALHSAPPMPALPAKGIVSATTAAAGSLAAHVLDPAQVEVEIDALGRFGLDELRLQWRNRWGRLAPAHLPRSLLFRLMAFRLQADVFGDLDRQTARTLNRLAGQEAAAQVAPEHASAGSGEQKASDPPATRSPSKTKGSESPVLKPGALLTREWQGRIERVMVLDEGFAWEGKTYASLSAVAFAITGVKWNGHRFFFGVKGRAGAMRIGAKVGPGWRRGGSRSHDRDGRPPWDHEPDHERRNDPERFPLSPTEVAP